MGSNGTFTEPPARKVMTQQEFINILKHRPFAGQSPKYSVPTNPGAVSCHMARSTSLLHSESSLLGPLVNLLCLIASPKVHILSGTPLDAMATPLHRHTASGEPGERSAVPGTRAPLGVPGTRAPLGVGVAKGIGKDDLSPATGSKLWSTLLCCQMGIQSSESRGQLKESQVLVPWESRGRWTLRRS